MGLNFKVEKLDVPDNASDVAGDIETWLAGLNIPTNHTVYSLSIVHLHGFFVCLVVYEP